MICGGAVSFGSLTLVRRYFNGAEEGGGLYFRADIQLYHNFKSV